MVKKYMVLARPRKNLSSFDVAHEYLWNRTKGVYGRIIEANSKKEARELYKNSYIGRYCVILHIEEI